MEFNASASNNNNNMVSSKTSEVDTDAPPRIQPSKLIPTTNGVLKRHHLHPHPHHHLIGPPVAAVIYKDCLKNHAASLGGYAVDGCGEFMPSLTAKSADPTSLKCDACGCHRNFHRREPEESPSATHTHLLEFQPHHRHHPPPPPHRNQSQSPADSPSPPPISSSFYHSAPHMLLALSGGGMQPENSPVMNASPTAAAAAVHGRSSNGRKRFRTKFSPDQKEKMFRFAETVGWKMQKRDEDSISRFCSDVGVDRGVFKVWMHNNKNALAKKDNNTSGGGGRNNLGIADHEDDGCDDHPYPDHGQHPPNYGDVEAADATNGCSSSS